MHDKGPTNYKLLPNIYSLMTCDRPDDLLVHKEI